MSVGVLEKKPIPSLSFLQTGVTRTEKDKNKTVVTATAATAKQ